jgi:acetyl-CoA synthetase
VSVSQNRDKPVHPPRTLASRPDPHSALHSRFGWHVPERFNMAQVCSGRWAMAPRRYKRHSRPINGYAGFGRQFRTYAELLQAQANRLSQVPAGLGAPRGRPGGDCDAAAFRDGGG